MMGGITSVDFGCAKRKPQEQPRKGNQIYLNNKGDVPSPEKGEETIPIYCRIEEEHWANRTVERGLRKKHSCNTSFKMVRSAHRKARFFSGKTAEEYGRRRCIYCTGRTESRFAGDLDRDSRRSERPSAGL